MQHQDYDDRFMIYMLSQCFSIGSMSVQHLLNRLHPLSSILDMNEPELIVDLELTEKQTQDIMNSKTYIENIYEEYHELIDRGISIVTLIDEDYPSRLKNIKDPPPCMYIKGKLPDDRVPSVSIVGSRGATNYGLGMAHFVAGELAKEGISIISGMAAGIDGAAHRGALEAGGQSYAILAGGVNVCYPRENYDIYEIMGEAGQGGVISECPPGSSPMRQFFPMRNRIISGLCDILIVIEAREKSGSLITVDHALNQGREIYALPGRMTDPLSRGCNELIKNGASILTRPADILDSLMIRYQKKLVLPDNNVNFLAKKEKVVYSCLNLEPKYAEDIVKSTNLPLGEVMGILLELELRGFITQLSGNYYAIKLD